MSETSESKRLCAHNVLTIGNPYGDEWSAGDVINAVDILESSGIKMISLADTVGVASAEQIRALVSAVIDKYGFLEIGAHLHSRAEQVEQKVLRRPGAARGPTAPP